MDQSNLGQEFQPTSVSSQPVAKKRSVKVPVIWIAIVIVIGVLGFFGGVRYEKHHLPKQSSNVSARGMFPGGGYGFRDKSGLRVIGQVSSINSSSITVQGNSGSSTTYSITGDTKIIDNGQDVNASDIQSGDTVIITKSSSSSSAAQQITVAPNFGQQTQTNN